MEEARRTLCAFIRYLVAALLVVDMGWVRIPNFWFVV